MNIATQTQAGDMERVVADAITSARNIAKAISDELSIGNYGVKRACILGAALTAKLDLCAALADALARATSTKNEGN